MIQLPCTLFLPSPDLLLLPPQIYCEKKIIHPEFSVVLLPTLYQDAETLGIQEWDSLCLCENHIWKCLWDHKYLWLCPHCNVPCLCNSAVQERLWQGVPGLPEGPGVFILLTISCWLGQRSHEIWTDIIQDCPTIMWDLSEGRGGLLLPGVNLKQTVSICQKPGKAPCVFRWVFLCVQMSQLPGLLPLPAPIALLCLSPLTQCQ